MLQLSRLALLAVVMAACQSSKAPEKAPEKAAEPEKAKVYTFGTPSAMSAPSWAPAALAKMRALKDEMCRCVDRACADKVAAELPSVGDQSSKSTEKPDQATIDAILQISVDTAQCKRKAGGTEAPPVAPGSASPVAAGSAAPQEDPGNTALEVSALDLLDKLAVVVAADAKNCGKLATDLERFNADHRDIIGKAHELEHARTPAQRQLFVARNKARTDATTAKMKPAMDACSKDPKVQAAATAMAR